MVVNVRRMLTPDLEASSVSSAGEDDNENKDQDDDDSLITCSLLNTTKHSSSDDDELEKPEEEDTVDPEQRLVVYRPTSIRHQYRRRRPKRHITGQRRRRAELVRSICFDPNIMPSCDNFVYAGCYPDDSAFSNHFCNMWGFWEDDIEREQLEMELVTVAVEVRQRVLHIS